MIVSGDALILHSRKFGDSSRIVAAYSKEYGKISLLAKGAYKPKSKFGVSVEPLNLSRITFYKKPNRDLHLLSASEILVNLHKMHTDLDKMAYGFMLSEAIEQTQEQEAVNAELYELVKNAFILINNKDNAFSIFVHTILNVIQLLGFSIEFSNTTGVKADNYYYPFSGGKVTLSKPDTGRYYYFSSEILNFLYKIINTEAEESAKVDPGNVNKQKIINFFIEYLSFHLEKRFHFKSQKLLMV